MGLSIVKDVTSDFNADSKVNLDISGFDVVVLQIESPSGAINFNTTNDSGAVQGVSDGNASTATAWRGVQGTDVLNGSGATNASATTIIKFTNFGRFIQFVGSAVTVSRMLVMLYKIG